MVVVKDLVRDAGSIDTTKDLDVGTAIRRTNVRRETSVGMYRQLDLKEGSWNVVALEFDFFLVASLDGSGEDGVDGEEEEVVITSGGIRGRCIRGRGSHFHGAEAGGHSLEAVVREELELEEEEEAEERGARRDGALVDKDEGLVGDEHLSEFFVYCRADRVLVFWH